MELGHNDIDGRFHCGLCDYVSRAFGSFEMAESEAVRHIWDEHGKRVLFAVQDDTGTVKPTPQGE